MNLNEIINIGRIESEFDITEGLKVKMHTLSGEEQAIVINRTADKALDAYGRKNSIDIEMLVASITEINGVEVTEATTREFVNKIQATLQFKLLALYNSIELESRDKLEEIKKV